MNRIVLTITALSLLLVACTTAAPPPAPAASSPQPERLIPVRVMSAPDNAEIILEGKLIGMTDTTLHLEEREYRIELRHPDHPAWSRTVSVVPGTRIFVDLRKNRS